MIDPISQQHSDGHAPIDSSPQSVNLPIDESYSLAAARGPQIEFGPRDALASQLGLTETAQLGSVSNVTLESSLGPILVRPQVSVEYPATVVQALAELYQEYNEAFTVLVDQNTEWPTDYQYNKTPAGGPLNHFVQIDMAGLPAGFLEHAATMDVSDVKEVLRGTIFEIENSLAMYQLLEQIFVAEGEVSLFKAEFREALDNLRLRHGKPIALLAVTDEKYDAMKTSEFGVPLDQELDAADVRRLSGFDRMFSPQEFLEHLESNDGKSDYLLYARTSTPVSKLRKPDTEVVVPLLQDPAIREVIKANSITHNIDNPAWEQGDTRTINDTKRYLPTMGMGFEVTSHEQLQSPEFKQYLTAQGLDPETTMIRAKPLVESYGCYGHISGEAGKQSFATELRKNIAKRGPYILQPEKETPVVTDSETGQSFKYIDRNFFTTDGTDIRFMGGFRCMAAVESTEARNGRLHGNKDTQWVKITPEPQ